MIISVPSAGRADRVLTLKLLEEAGLERDTYLLVPAAQEADYRRYNPSAVNIVPLPYDSTVVTRPGEAGLLADARNLWTAHHVPGTQLTWMDDDIQAVRWLVDGKLAPAPIRAVLALGWKLAATHDVTLWGVYPVNNAFFMRPEPGVGLMFCIGQFYGVEVTGLPQVDRVTVWGKEDYERTLRHYLHKGAVARLNNVAAASPIRHGDGGLQVVPDRMTVELDQIGYLQGLFPGLVGVKHRKSGYPEIRLALATE